VEWRLDMGISSTSVILNAIRLKLIRNKMPTDKVDAAMAQYTNAKLTGTPLLKSVVLDLISGVMKTTPGCQDVRLSAHQIDTLCNFLFLGENNDN